MLFYDFAGYNGCDYAEKKNQVEHNRLQTRDIKLQELS